MVAVSRKFGGGASRIVREWGMPPRSRAGMALVPVDPSEERRIRQYYELRTQVMRADLPHDPPPCWVYERGRFHYPWPGESEQLWVVQASGAVVGACLLTLPLLDNLHNAGGEIMVAPEHRGRGIGRALLDRLRREAARHRRTQLVLSVDHPLDPAAPDPVSSFLSASGAQRALVQTRRRLDVDSANPQVLDRLAARARTMSAGYQLVQWVGATPARWLDDIAYLTARMSTDVPLGDLQWEPETYDAARVRAVEASCLARGLHLVTTAARDRSGPLVAFTRIVSYATSPWFGGQWDTIVAPQHRGRRLGILIKVANLHYARAQRAQLRIIDTCNADSNPYIITINEAMGFRPHCRTIDWQLTVLAAPAGSRAVEGGGPETVGVCG
jgi:GNAT superfamily N-acetyltransferase